MDSLILAFDRALRTLSGSAQMRRANPAASLAREANLSDEDRKISVSLMRVNHAGEVAAQALYQGQALTAKSSAVQQKLAHASDEELDHLVWTRQRLSELGGRPSLFDPLWYSGAFVIGAMAGADFAKRFKEVQRNFVLKVFLCENAALLLFSAVKKSLR